MVTLVTGVEVEVEPPPFVAVTATVLADLISMISEYPQGIDLDIPSVAPSFVAVPEPELLILPVAGPTGNLGPPGPRGVAGDVVEYLMPVAQTTAVIDHELGYDPVAVQVFDGPQLCDEFSVVFTVPGQQVTVGFDVSVAALIRLI